MKISYTGRTEALAPQEIRKIEAKFSKLAKLLDAPKGEREAHVILNTERHLHNAEITVRYFDHSLVGIGSAADGFLAVSTALEKLEKQIHKLKERVRDTKRGPKQEKQEIQEFASAATAEEEAAAEAESERTTAPQVFRIDHHERRKPMTLDEALIEIEDRNYVVYRDAETGHVSVLVRRRDGNFDLIEA